MKDDVFPKVRLSQSARNGCGSVTNLTQQKPIKNTILICIHMKTNSPN